MQAIGIDLGTTGICGVAIDCESGAVINSKTVDSNAFISGEAFEKIQSPEKIIFLAKSILDELICDDTAVIGVTGQMHGILYYDAEGEAVSPLYTWQDGRGDLPYKNTTYAGFLGSHTGYGNVTDFYNRENGMVPKNAVGYCTIHDWLVMKLCGLKKAKMHISDAASLGLFDLKTEKFSYNCDICVINDYMIAGSYKKIPVSIAIGDNQASVFSCLSNDTDLLINIGTGSQVSAVTNKIITAESLETRPYFENKYLVVGAALCGGRAYALLKDFYKQILGYKTPVDDTEVYFVMNKMLEMAEKGALSVDTRFSGTRADSTVRGSISGISADNFTPENLTAGVLEGMINELFEMYSEMGIACEGIVGSGNGIRKNKALIKTAEERFGVTLKIPTHLEEAAFGAAMFGLVSEGIFKNAEEVRKLIRF